MANSKKYEMTNEEKLALFEKLLADGVLEIPKDKEKTGFYAGDLKPSEKLQIREQEPAEQPRAKRPEPEELVKNPRTTAPSYQVITTDKLTNFLFDRERYQTLIKEGAIGVKVGYNKKEPVITTLKAVNWKPLNWNTEINPLTGFDHAVLDAVNTLYKANIETEKKAFSGDQIYRCMIGKPKGSGKPSPKMANKIEDTMIDLMTRWVEIDATQEADKMNYHFDKVHIKAPIISGVVVTIEAGGQRVDGYKIDRLTLLNDYSEPKKQLDSSLPVELNATPISKNENSISLQEFLKRRILAIKSGGVSNIINVENLLDELEIIKKGQRLTVSNRKKKAKTIDNIKKVLDYWETVECKDGKPFITGYKMHGKSPIKSIEIIF